MGKRTLMIVVLVTCVLPVTAQGIGPWSDRDGIRKPIYGPFTRNEELATWLEGEAGNIVTAFMQRGINDVGSLTLKVVVDRKGIPVAANIVSSSGDKHRDALVKQTIMTGHLLPIFPNTRRKEWIYKYGLLVTITKGEVRPKVQVRLATDEP